MTRPDEYGVEETVTELVPGKPSHSMTMDENLIASFHSCLSAFVCHQSSH